MATTELPTAASHPFYARLNGLLRDHGFDDFAEAQCAPLYAKTMGRPGLAPGIYFRLLLIGYFEGIDSERGIAWRAADSLTLRDFLGLTLPAAPPDHSTISRTRRLIDLETHRALFTWVLQCLGQAGLVKGKTIEHDQIERSIEGLADSSVSVACDGDGVPFKSQVVFESQRNSRIVFHRMALTPSAPRESPT